MPFARERCHQHAPTASAAANTFGGLRYSAPDHVLATLRDIRAARGSNAKIQSQLLPPRTRRPSAGGLVAAPPPLAADGSLHVYRECSPLGANELSKLRRAGGRIERLDMARGLVQAWVGPSALDTLAVRGVDQTFA
jgi:hypothetical protein